MRIKKVKLIDGGYAGLVISGEYIIKKGGIPVIQKIDGITSNLPIPSSLKAKFQYLKYHLLNLSNHLFDELSEFIDEDKTLKELKISKKDKLRHSLYHMTHKLFENTEITVVNMNSEEGIILSGTIRNLSGKRLKVGTPTISNSDHYHEHASLFKASNICLAETNKYINQKEKFIVMHPIEYFKHKYWDNEKFIKELSNKSKIEIDVMYLNELADQGCIELSSDHHNVKLHYESD